MNSKIIKILVSLMVLGFCFGCAARNNMYYWGKYSDTLYHTKKKPGSESLAEHKEMLENIVKESKNRNLRIPPGVCAELGYLYASQNNTQKAIELFHMEKQIYPESTILMDRLIQQSEKRAGTESTVQETSVEKMIEKEKEIGKSSNE